MELQIIFLFWTALLIQSGKLETLEPHEVSHVALIGRPGADGEIKFDCTGSYLGRNVILTGARCLEPDGVAAKVVRLGAGWVGDDTMDFHVLNWTIHYRFEEEYYYHNLAVLFLKEDPQSISERFRPACVYSKPPPIEGKVYLVGRDEEAVFQKTELEFVDADKCHEFYTPTKKLKYGAMLVCCMCAWNPSTTKCAAELSAPMQVTLEKNGKRVPFLVGQKTIGRSCGTNVPGIYTRLSSDGHLPWLMMIAQMNFTDHDACIEKY